jgi:hypothetical protein
MKNAVLILGGFVLAYWILEHSQRLAAARVGAPSSSSAGIVPYQVGSVPGGGGSAGGVSGESLAFSGASEGLSLASNFAQAGSAAAKAIPIVGAFVSIGESIAGIFGAQHKKAVATEAAVLNASVPAFFKACDQIMTALDNGQLTPDEAKKLLDQAVAGYYQGVSGPGSGHIEKGGPCAIDITKPDLGRTTMKYPPHCNGPCVQGCGNVETTAAGLKRLIDQGGGTFTSMNGIGTGPHAGFAGYPPTTWSYEPYKASLRSIFNLN